MDKVRNESLRFDSSEARWREVSSNMKDSANAIWDYWKRAWETAHKQCDELAKGDQHKDVVRAVRDLDSIGSNAERELLQLRTDHRKWYDEIKELREWFKQDTANVRQLFCTLQESPGDTDVGDAYAAQLAQIADRMRDRLDPKWRDLSSRGAKLIPQLTQLEKVQDEGISKGASVILEKLLKTMNSIENVLNNELKGANDPEVRAQIEVGKNEHKRIQADGGKCHESEITIPGKGRRIDCVYVSSGTCTIYEIKPNNSNAINKGRTQAREYQELVQDYFDSNKDKPKEAFTGKMEVFLKCIAAGRISLAYDVRAYEFCPQDGKLFQDFVVPAE